VEAHRRDLRGGAHRRGPGRDRRAGRARDGARAGHHGGLRTLLRGERHRARRRPRRGDVGDPRRLELGDLPRACPGGQRPARACAQRRGGRPLRLPGRGELDHARRRRHARPRRRLDAARARRRPSRTRARLLAAGRGADERALPLRRRAGQGQTGPRARGPRHHQARARPVAGPLRPAPDRDRRDDPQPRRRGPTRPRGSRGRRAGLRHRARGARPPRGGAGSADAGRARQVPRDQALARRPHPRRRDRGADGDGGRGLRRHRGDRGRPARGCVLRAPPRGGSAPVRRRPPRERRQPCRPVRDGPGAQPARRARRAPRARALRRAGRGRRAPTATPPSASSCGPGRCCTTSA
jgi:hypothetical protein